MSNGRGGQAGNCITPHLYDFTKVIWARDFFKPTTRWDFVTCFTSSSEITQSCVATHVNLHTIQENNNTNIEIGSVKPYFILVVIEVNKIQPVEDSVIKARQKGKEERQEWRWFPTLHQQGKDEGSLEIMHDEEPQAELVDDPFEGCLSSIHSQDEGHEEGGAFLYEPCPPHRNPEAEFAAAVPSIRGRGGQQQGQDGIDDSAITHAINQFLLVGSKEDRVDILLDQQFWREWHFGSVRFQLIIYLMIKIKTVELKQKNNSCLSPPSQIGRAHV